MGIEIVDVDGPQDGVLVTLPDGVYPVGDEIPPHRAEIFRANGRVYTVQRQVDPRVAFKLIRSIKNGDGDRAQAELLYQVLGEGVIDFLADEELTPDQFQAVMKAVRKYSMGAVKDLLGN